MNEPTQIRHLLNTAKTIAVIGLSANSTKPSHYVPAYLQQHGYTLYPINPSLLPTPGEVLGEKAYASLTDLVAAGIRPDLVNVFRLPAAIPPIVDEMLTLNLPALWVQQGIVNPIAAATAEAAGISVVMDRCIMVEHRRIALDAS